MRDCTNCKVMLYTQTEPVVEACSKIEFSVTTYWYEELLDQLQKAGVSPWCNKWNEVFDFTAHKQAADGSPNWELDTGLNWDMIAPLYGVNEKMTKVKELKGDDQVKSVKDIEEADLEQIVLEFDEEEEIMPALFDVGPYWNQYA